MQAIKMNFLKKIFRKFQAVWKEWECYSLFNTLYLNFRTLPFKQAIRLPIKVGRRVEFIGLRKGCITFDNSISIRPFIVRLFACKYPMYANKGNFSLMRYTGGGTLVLGTDIDIYSGCRIILVNNGCITIKNDVLINQNCMLYASASLLIDTHSRIGWNCQIYDSDFHLMYDKKNGHIKTPYGKVNIGHNVWIANSCTIGKNAIIPPFSIVASHSFVNKDFSDLNVEGTLFAGSPAKVKREGLYRILNLGFESKYKWEFMNTQCDRMEVEDIDLTYLLNLKR